MFRSGVDAIARAVAKLNPKHVINRIDCETVPGSCKLNKILQVQPNQHINSYDFLYRIAAQYFETNNAFIFISRSPVNGALESLWPVIASTVEVVQDGAGIYFYRFTMKDGNRILLPESEIIHLRRCYNNNELFGMDNSPVFPALNLSQTQQDGLSAAIKSGANIRGIVKINNVVGDKAKAEARDLFINDYLSMANTGGVVVVDESTEYTPITSTPVTIDEKQMAAVKTMIYNYLGISEKIVDSSYTEDEWLSFYESIIEPFSIQLSNEFTRKIFTEREQAFGNEIQFDPARLQFSTYGTRANIISQLLPYGVLTVNQALDMMDLPRVDNGDERLVPLNMIQADKANQFQGVSDPTQPTDGTGAVKTTTPTEGKTE